MLYLLSNLSRVPAFPSILITPPEDPQVSSEHAWCCACQPRLEMIDGLKGGQQHVGAGRAAPLAPVLELRSEQARGHDEGGRSAVARRG
eukprot:2250633-Pleurochrysis_carterae.AAC.1